MWSHMARGELWEGDPLEELGLEAPTKPGGASVVVDAEPASAPLN
jgi:hypothetical protein